MSGSDVKLRARSPCQEKAANVQTFAPAQEVGLRFLSGSYISIASFADPLSPVPGVPNAIYQGIQGDAQFFVIPAVKPRLETLFWRIPQVLPNSARHLHCFPVVFVRAVTNSNQPR
jgi:hypothetical protein